MRLLTRLILLAGVSLVPAIVIQTVNELEARSTRRVEVHLQASREAQNAAAEIHRMLEGIRGVLTTLARIPSVQVGASDECDPLFRTLVAENPSYLNIATAGLDGRLQCTAVPARDPNINVRNRPYFKAVETNDFWIGEFTRALSTPYAVLQLAYPLRDNEGRPKGVVWIALTVEAFKDQFVHRMPAQNASLTIVDRNGVILMRLPEHPDLVGQRVPEQYLSLIAEGDPRSANFTGLTGDKRIYGSAPLDMVAKGLAVVYGINEAAAFAPVDQALWRGILLIAIGIFFALVAAILGSRYFFGRPVTALLKAATAWGGGDYGARTGLDRSRDEFGTLGRAFDRMAALIAERNRELQEARDEAVRANDAKTRFLAAASHDLRQPIQATRLFLEVLDGQKLDSASRIALDRAIESHEASQKLLNVLLDISTLEAGAVQPEFSIFPVDEVLSDVVRDFKPAAEIKHMVLRQVTCRASVRSDRVLLTRIVRNLVANAIAHGGGGKVLVGCRHRGEVLRIEVRDTGPGIPRDKIQAIFGDFYQISNQERNRERGFGLGLAIVSRMAMLLGHAVDVRSSPGRGSCFAVDVPLSMLAAPISASAPEAAEFPAPGDSLILVIEDDMLQVLGMEMLLEEWGYRVLTAPSPTAAVSALKQQNHMPALVISDYRLPGEFNGIQGVRHIRTTLNATLPALIVTGETDRECEREAAENGCGILKKPYLPQELHARLRAALLEDRKAQSAA